ncbi:unnamed protein product [Dicrocoelium dendriticum]|nr:unnamed protein product [Dicrocoelium dendriticum]
MVKLFSLTVSELTLLVKKYEMVFKHEEDFPTFFNKTDLFSLRSGRSLCNIISELQKAEQIYANFQSVNENYFLEPLKKVFSVLRMISPLFDARENAIKDIEKHKKKCSKMEGAERTGENLAKLAKYRSQMDASIARLESITSLLEKDLCELTLRTELFFGRVIKAHLNWKYQVCLASSQVNAYLADELCGMSQSGSLSTLEAEITNQLAEVRKLPLTRPLGSTSTGV